MSRLFLLFGIFYIISLCWFGGICFCFSGFDVFSCGVGFLCVFPLLQFNHSSNNNKGKRPKKASPTP